MFVLDLSMILLYDTCTYFHHLSAADVDECERDTDGCSHNCTNTIGSYDCSCPNGFLLHSDGLLCNGNDSNVTTVRDNISKPIYHNSNHGLKNTT